MVQETARGRALDRSRERPRAGLVVHDQMNQPLIRVFVNVSCYRSSSRECI